MRSLRTLAIGCLIFLAWMTTAQAQKWTPLKNQPTFMPDGAGPALLLTDGSVMVHDAGGASWWKLIPDNTGSYVNGTWKQLASLPSGYAPLYYASAVLPDGRVMVEGGEYNNGQDAWTTLGAIYDPASNKWTKITPPSGWTTIGDSQSVILKNGTFVLANCCEGSPYAVGYLNPSKLTWTLNGTGKADRYDEEGWVLLKDGTIMTTDAIDSPNSERYFPTQKKWKSEGKVPVQLEDQNSQEIGPMVLRPDGTVFATGAQDQVTHTGHTAIYKTAAKSGQKGTWTKGPDFPGGNDCEDAPAALEINGKVLVMTSPGVFSPPSTFYEWDGKKLSKIAGPPNANNDPSYVGSFLELPSGQLLFMDFSSDMEVFTASGSYDSSWAPTISTFPSSVTRGSTYPISGTQFNGLSQGAMYGDDAQMASNYPLVRITNDSTGHVFYAKTHGHSTMGVATGNASVSTNFDVPSGAETGSSPLEVVANGIPSTPVVVTVQ